MAHNPFQTRTPAVADNQKVRVPQREAFDALVQFARHNDGEREVGIILPVGCGKSGCIALTPFAFRSERTLVVAPGTDIAGQLHNDFDPANPEMFYLKSESLRDAPYPEPAEIRGTTTNLTDLEEAHVVITNIQQLQGATNRTSRKLHNYQKREDFTRKAVSISKRRVQKRFLVGRQDQRQ